MPITDGQPAPVPLHRRRWYQFSLRTLMIVMLLASVGMSWFAVRIERAKRQQEAVASVQKLGGIVLHDWDGGAFLNFCRGRPFAFREPPPPGWLSLLLGIDFRGKVVGVKLCGARVTDADLETLKKLPHLEVLRLEDTNTTCEGIAAIQEFLPNCSIMAFDSVASISATDKIAITHVQNLLHDNNVIPNEMECDTIVLQTEDGAQDTGTYRIRVLKQDAAIAKQLLREDSENRGYWIRIGEVTEDRSGVELSPVRAELVAPADAGRDESR